MNVRHDKSWMSAPASAILLLSAALLASCGTRGGSGAPQPTPTFQGVVSMNTDVSGAEEVPPVATAGSGTAVFSMKPGTGDIVGKVDFAGLSAIATVAHIHQVAAGSDIGPPIITLEGGAGAAAGTFTVPAGTVLTADQRTALVAGRLYVNIHTANNPDGEIRGDIAFPTTTVGATALSGSEMVPPVTGTANGTGTLTVNLGTGQIAVGSIVFSGLSSNATLAHIHQGAAGTNGEIIVDMIGGSGGTSGTWTVPAGTMLSADAMNALINDELYFTVHSVNNAAGELRGQIRLRVVLTPELSGAEEVPPVATAGTGGANLSLNPATGALSGSVVFSDLSSNATLSHIHEGAAGVNGLPVITLEGGAGAPSGTWTVPVGTVLTMAQLNTLKADGFYINIHSVNNVGGEIRGQIVRP